MRLDGGLGLEPVENVHGPERALVRQPVGSGVSLGGRQRLRALVEQVDVGRACARRVQAEAAQKTETIQNLRAFRKLRYGLIIGLLVEIQTRLVPADEVRLKLQPVQLHGNRPVQFANQNSTRSFQSLKLARRHITAFKNRARRKDLLQRGDNQCFPLVHPQGGDLHNQYVLIFINDKAAQKITLGIDDPE